MYSLRGCKNAAWHFPDECILFGPWMAFGFVKHTQCCVVTSNKAPLACITLNV